MTEYPRSIRDVVEALRQEFEGKTSVRDVNDVVARLSANGAVSLPVLAHLARAELRLLGGSEIH